MRCCPTCRTQYTTDVEFCGLDGTRLVDVDRDPLLGATIDRWVIEEKLGGGAMAAVYRARHQVIDRSAALKVLYGEYASDKQFAERFRREAQAASRIKHKNVVEVLDFGVTPEGASFLLMELLEGHTLSEAIQLGGAMAPRRAAMIARDVAEGLAAAHAQGLIHRDLKPGNIMLCEDGGREAAKIVDFGVVHLSSFGEKQDDKLTHTGQTLGTPFYMAPEQISGDSELTERTDLYALGVVIYEMLEGTSPFRGSLGEVLVKHVTEKPAKLPPSGGLEKLVKKLLQKEPKKRPPNAHAVVNEIDRLDLGGPLPFTPLHETLPPMLDPPSHEIDVTNDAHTVGFLETDGYLPEEEETLDKHDDDRPLEDATTEPFPAPRRPGPARSRAAAPPSSNLPVALAGALVAAGVLALFLSLTREPNVPPPPEASAEERVEQVLALREEVRAAAAGRGLTLDELSLLPPLAAAWTRFEQASGKVDLDGAGAAADELVPAIAGVDIERELLDKKIARLRAVLEDGSVKLPVERRREMMNRLLTLQEGREQDMAAAERSHLALRLRDLEVELAQP